MNKVWRGVGVLIVMIVATLAVYSQDVTKPQTTTQDVTKRQSTDDYKFPTASERFKRYVTSTVGPIRLVRTGASAGIEQWRDTPEEWGQGAKGYGKRYASGLGQNAIQQTVTYGLDSAFQLDTGFQKSKRTGFFPRLKHALLENVTSRNKSGKRVISVPRFAGAYTGAIIASETWYPERYSYKDGLRKGTGTLLTGFGINLLREFVINF